MKYGENLAKGKPQEILRHQAKKAPGILVANGRVLFSFCLFCWVLFFFFSDAQNSIADSQAIGDLLLPADEKQRPSLTCGTFQCIQ